MTNLVLQGSSGNRLPLNTDSYVSLNRSTGLVDSEAQELTFSPSLVQENAEVEVRRGKENGANRDDFKGEKDRITSMDDLGGRVECIEPGLPMVQLLPEEVKTILKNDEEDETPFVRYN